MICVACGRTLTKDSAFCRFCGAPQPDAVPMPPVQPRKRTHGNGMGYAYKRGSTWTARIRVASGANSSDSDDIYARPKFIEHTKGGFKTKKEALQYCATLKGIPKKEQKKTLASYWAIYERDTLPKKSKSTQTAQKIAYKKLGYLPLRDITTITVSDLRDAVSAAAPTYYPARDMKVVLSHLFNLAAADGIVSKDLPSFIELPEKNETERMPFTIEEMNRIEMAWNAGTAFAGYILLMIYSGMMPGELLTLKKNMIDLDSQTISGAGIKTERRKKTDIVFPEFIVPVLQKLMALHPKSPKLLPISEDNFYAAYYETLEKAQCRRLTPYSCRHSTATALALHPEIPPALISRIMRHSAKMTEHYTHPDNSDAVAAINRLHTTSITPNIEPETT